MIVSLIQPQLKMTPLSSLTPHLSSFPETTMAGPSKSIEKDKSNGEVKTRRRPGRVPVSCAECRRYVLSRKARAVPLRPKADEC